MLSTLIYIVKNSTFLAPKSVGKFSVAGNTGEVLSQLKYLGRS